MGPYAVLDVAGVAIALEAVDPDRATIATNALAGFAPTTRRPAGTVRVVDEPAVPPTAPPRDELFGVRLWAPEPGGPVVVASARSVVVVEGDRVTAHVPDLADAAQVEGMFAVGLTWLLGRHDRFVVHAGAVARAERGLLVLGSSGAGKSTLVAAALEHGWRALADDLVVVGEEGGALRIWGVHRWPAIPIEIGGPVVAHGVRIPGPRARAELAPTVLSPDPADVTGVVLVAHAPEPNGSLRPVSYATVLPLLLQSFSGTLDPDLRRRYFAFTERAAALPRWELGHAADAGARRAHVAEALAACVEEGAAAVSDRR